MSGENQEGLSSPLFGSHMVLPRGVPVTVRGRSAAGAEVRVEFRGGRWRAQTDDTGIFAVRIGPLEPGPASSLEVRGATGFRQVLEDVLVGDVWLCSGQSNMAMALRHTATGTEDAAGADDPGLRLLQVPARVSPEPQSGLPACSWSRCTPEAAAGFSAVGYYFGRGLRRSRETPIGLIEAAVGATPAESWVAYEVLAGDPEFQPILERWTRSLALFPDPGGTVQAAFARWDRETDQAEREGRPIPGAHPKLIGPDHPWRPAGLFNGMIAPLTSFPIRGVTWYQGAGAPERARQYRRLFRTLIRDWRARWGQGDFPFLFVQEAAFGPKRADPCEHSWAELREAQAMALAEPNTAMVVAIDTGDERDIHPKVKAPLGERLALAARAVAYGERVAYSGPVYRDMTVEESGIRIRFDHVQGGLRTADGGPLRGFAVSGGCTDFSAGHRGFAWAEARIEGDSVVVQSDRVPRPVAVRYNWAQNPDGNLANGAGLPAAPFRTDTYPGVTDANR